MRILTTTDVQAVNGAGLPGLILRGLELIGAVDAAKDFIDGFTEGFKDGYERNRNQ